MRNVPLSFHWERMARHKLDSVNEFARRGYWLRILCETCQHETHANPIAIMGELHARRASLAIDRLEDRLRCSACGKAGARVMPCEPPG